jgi:hypothetical protein
VTVNPFDAGNDPKPAALPAEKIAPMVFTADQLAFAAKVQLAKPHAIPHRAPEASPRTVNETTAAQQPAEPVHSEPRSQHQDSHRDADPQFSMKTAEAAVKPAARPAHTAPGFEIVTGAAEKPVASPKTEPTASGPERPTSAAASHDAIPSRPEVPAAPMKDISVRIQSEQGENVDVRIVRRAGDLQIAVKSASGETAEGLRHGLSELSDRLNATGYHADTWHPGQPAAATADSGNSQNSQQQHHQSQGDSQSHSGWSQEQSGRRDDNHSNRPRWIEELESNVSSPAETGLFHGLIR